MDASQYKCPNCGAELVFDPATQQLHCEFCRSSFTTEQVQNAATEAAHQAAPDTAENNTFADHTNLYICQNCGAEIMAEDDTTATFCYYCHSPVILSGRLKGNFRPDKIIGFKISREQALDMFKNWCKSKKYIPRDFQSSQQLEKMTGLYVPFWVADCHISAEYHGIGRKTRSWTSGSYRYTETQEFAIDRSADIVAKGIPADGESKIEDLLMESIEPFDYSDLKPFDMSYFSGFFADKYDVDRAGVFPRIRERAAEAGRKMMRDTIVGYNTTSAHHESYNVSRTDWQYIMLPVWFMTYNYKGEVYEFAINGQTGKLAGTPPLDKGRLKRTAMLFGLMITALVFLGGQFLI